MYDTLTDIIEMGWENPFVLLRGLLMGHQNTDKIPDFLRPRIELQLKN